MTHITVLRKEAVDYLNPKKGSVFVDATLGSGGHSLEICKRNSDVKIIGIDRDKAALKRSSEALQETKCDFKALEENFRNLDKVLDGLGIEKVDGFIFDLGLSSEQIEESGRGFSFSGSEPLLMTFKEGPSEKDFTAEGIINNWNEETLSNIIFGYGEERYARRIAREIVKARKEKPIKTTSELVEIIRKAVPKNYLSGRRHFATKTFQGLRIAVNDELQALKEGLEKSFERLKKGRRMVVISFHGLEDKIVKNFFKAKVKEESGKIITKKPISPERSEVERNPRSRSAKMRVIEKI